MTKIALPQHNEHIHTRESHFLNKKLAKRDFLLEQCLTRRRVVFWGSLSAEESAEYVKLCEIRNAWYRAWEYVRETHQRYGIPYNGPTCWIPDHILIRHEELNRKGWGLIGEEVKKELEGKKQVREANTQTVEESKGNIPL